jgi:hypothetical protein
VTAEANLANDVVGELQVGILQRGQSPGAADVEVSCTLVDGVLMASGYFTKSANVGAGGVNFIQWSGVDENAGENFGAPALSCNLPSGVDIGMVMFEYPEEIGTAAP